MIRNKMIYTRLNSSMIIRKPRLKIKIIRVRMKIGMRMRIMSTGRITQNKSDRKTIKITMMRVRMWRIKMQNSGRAGI